MRTARGRGITPPAASEWYVSTTGSSGNPGTIGSPWSLVHALSHPAAVKPGDTIWVRGGTYSGNFETYLIGASSAPIKVRAYPGERATISASGTTVARCLLVFGNYTWYWGLELRGNPVTRHTAVYGGADISGLPYGVDNRGNGNRFIHLVLHDTAGGMGDQSGTNSEEYGVISYYNGSGQPGVDVYGQGAYNQQNSDASSKLQEGGLYLSNANGAVQWNSTGALHNITVRKNVFGASGDFIDTFDGCGSELRFTSGVGASNSDFVIEQNVTIPSVGVYGCGSGLNIQADVPSLIVRDNEIYGPSYFPNAALTGSPVVTGNIFDALVFHSGIGGPYGFDLAYPSNTYRCNSGGGPVVPCPEPTTGTTVKVVPTTRYENGRGHIIAINRGLAATINVDLSSIVAVGTNYQIRNPRNFWGTPIASGLYAGGTISLPTATTDGYTANSAPIGLNTHTPAIDRRYPVYVVLTV